MEAITKEERPSKDDSNSKDDTNSKDDSNSPTTSVRKEGDERKSLSGSYWLVRILFIRSFSAIYCE